MTDLVRTSVDRPRLGFAGVGWIGLHRLKTILEDGCAEVALLTDPDQDAAREACAVTPEASLCGSLEEMLESDVDGVVIATPTGLHAEQAIRALEAGKAVFCQKPLGCTSGEARAVCEASRRADRLLGVDLSYRYAHAMRAVRDLVQAGELGDIYAVDLLFHNAYGPDAGWAFDRRLSGGGCIIDLGVHLIDLLLWTLDGVRVERTCSSLYRGGERLLLPTEEIEEYAVAKLELSSGATASLSCSWHHSAGKDAVIEASFHGTRASASFQNVGGSFYDFAAELRSGARTDVLVEPPDSWPGRAPVHWAKKLMAERGHDPAIVSSVAVADVLDRLYGRGTA